MIHDSLKITGYVDKIILSDEFGNVKQVGGGANLIVTTGKEFVASAIGSASASPFTHVACGTSNQAAALGDTALVGTELARVAATVTPSGATCQFVASFGAGVGTGIIEEIGILNNAVGGTMLSRYLTGTFDKGPTDILTVTWTITVG